MTGPARPDSLTLIWGKGHQSANFAWKFNAMTLKAKFFGALSSLLLVVLFFASSPIAANTSLQLGDGVVLSFADGNIDVRTGSGELEGVVVTEDGVELLTADYLMIDASGEIGGEDWFIHDLVMENALIAEAGLFINRTEIRDLAAGGLDDTSFSEPEGLVSENSFVRFQNLSLEAEEALVSIDEISSLPVKLAESAPGEFIVVDGGVAVKGMTVMPLEQARGLNPLMDKLADRGMSSVGMDIVFRTVTSPGDQFRVGYSLQALLRDLGAFDLAVEFSVNGQVYDELMSMLATPEENAVAMLGLSGAIALDAASIIVEDTGLFDILFAVAADEQGVSEEDMRSMARMTVVAGLATTFPENVSALLPPLEEMLKTGGRLSIEASPSMPVPLSSVIGFAMMPDLAIDQLGISVTHQP
ncbi:MAG: hypothetical protein VX773_05775 [Pseudomonadota bacterium]|nr:hypothetical protein [Pseudomonadota bacterium]